MPRQMFHDVRYRLRAIFRRKSMEADLEEEIRFHIELQRAKAGEVGATSLAPGEVERLKEECRDARGVSWWETTAQDVRFATRQLRRNPGFTLGVIATLTLGLGAATALFAVTNSVLLRPLPVADPKSLVVIGPDPAHPYPGQRVEEYEALKRDCRSVFSGTAASNESNRAAFSIAGAHDSPLLVNAAFASDNYFEVLGVTPAMGRLFLDGSAVLSYGFWQSRFAGNPGVIGLPVRLNGAVVQIAGVAPKHFAGTRVGNAPDVYVSIGAFPSVMAAMSDNWKNPAHRWLVVTARMRAGVSMAQATSQVDATLGRSATLLPGVKGFRGPAATLSVPLLILLCTSGLVLLMACANIAGLLLARASGRQRETAVRLALGAGRGRLIRQLLTENMLLAFLGGVAGLLTGLAGGRALIGLLPGDGGEPLAIDVTPDWRVFLFALGASAITGLFFGLWPALTASGRELVPALKGWGLSTRRRRVESRRVLVSVQVALSVLVLTAVFLLVRTLAQLESVDLGFDRDGILLVNIEPGQFGYKGARLHDFYDRVRERIAMLPGVRQASLSDYAPLDGGNDSGVISTPGRAQPLEVQSDNIAPGYLETIGIGLMDGRDFTVSDGKPEAPAAALISESAARLLFPGANVVGKRISYGERYQPSESYAIVGVVHDAKYLAIREHPEAMVYTSVGPFMRRLTISIRTSSAPARLIPAVRQVVAKIDPAVPVLSARTMAEQVDEQNAKERLLLKLLACFGVLALVIAAVGLYGLLAYGVAARTREIGIRIALGATQWEAVKTVLGDVRALVGWGVAAGLVAAAGAARLLRGILFGIKPFDPVSFAAPLIVLGLTALIAAYFPARRAAAVDPLVALRHE